MQCFILPKFLFICSSLAFHIPFTWPMIFCESPWITTNLAPNALAKSKLLIRVSYSALLLVVWNYRRMTYSRQSLLGNCKITLTPLAFWVDEPSTWTILCPRVFSLLTMNWSELRNEIRKYLAFYSFSWSILHIKLIKFNCPLDQSSNCFELVHGLLKWVVCQEVDDMSLEVGSEFPYYCYDRKSQLLHWCISSFSSF